MSLSFTSHGHVPKPYTANEVDLIADADIINGSSSRSLTADLVWFCGNLLIPAVPDANTQSNLPKVGQLQASFSTVLSANNDPEAYLDDDEVVDDRKRAVQIILDLNASDAATLFPDVAPPQVKSQDAQSFSP